MWYLDNIFKNRLNMSNGNNDVFPAVVTSYICECKQCIQSNYCVLVNIQALMNKSQIRQKCMYCDQHEQVSWCEIQLSCCHHLISVIKCNFDHRLTDTQGVVADKKQGSKKHFLSTSWCLLVKMFAAFNHSTIHRNHLKINWQLVLWF